MDKKTLNEARMAFESAGCALENTICEYLSAFGENGVELTRMGAEAEYSGNFSEPDFHVKAVRFFEDELEGRDAGGKWHVISAYNRKADYSVSAGLLCMAIEMLP